MTTPWLTIAEWSGVALGLIYLLLAIREQRSCWIAGAGASLLFLGVFWRGGNGKGAVAGMVSGFVTALVLTAIYPDDIAGLGSLTGGVVGMAVNLAVFLIVSKATGTTAEEKARVDAMFEVGKRPTRTAPVDLSFEDQIEELATNPAPEKI